MRLIRFIFPVLLFFSSLAHAAPEAILTGVKGAVQVVQNGKTSAGKNGLTLNAGDSVRVGADGVATVYYANRPPQSLKANQQIQVAAPGQATAPSVWSNVYKGVAAGFARRGEKVGATVRAGDELPFASEAVIPLSPVNTRVQDRPTLSWILRDAPGDFSVVLRDAEGNEVWQSTAAQSSLAVPPQVPLVVGKKYNWVVTPQQRDAAGKVTSLDEKASLKSWFEIAPAADVEVARQERLEIAAALQDESEFTRRVAQASVFAERGFYDQAIALLTNRSLETALAKSNAAANMRGALSAFDAMISNMDEAARWQLRKLYADTKQIELAARIAPDISVQEAVVGGQETAILQPPVSVPQPATDYADEGGAFALRVPQGWTTKREAAEGASLTTFSSGGPADPQITVISQPLVATQNLETFGPQWIGQILEILRQTGTVKAETTQKAKFLGRDAMRAAVDYDSPQTGPQRGYLTVIFGAKNALMIGYSAAVEKPLELGRLEAILNSFAVEANKPSTDAKTVGALGVDLSPTADFPPALRETMAQSEELIRIGYEILNPPLMGQDENGKVLSPPAMRAAFDAQIAQLKAAPLNSLARWRAARDSASLAMQLSWMASEAKKTDEAAAWFTLANDYKKTSYEAARHYYTAHFEDGKKKVAALEARVPVESPFSDDRNLLETLYHVQGMRAGTLDNLARMHYDYAAILKWGEAQVDTHRRAQKYTQYDYKDFDLTKPENDWARKALFQAPLSIAGGLESMAEAQSNLGRFEQAEKTLLQSLEMRRSVPQDYVQRYPDIPLRQLGSLFKTLGDYRRAHDYYLQALKDIDASMPARKVRREAENDAAFRELMLVETAQTRATLLNNLSLVVGYLGDFKTAEQHLNQSLAEMEAVPDSPRAHPIVLWHRATALGNRGVLRIDTGEEDKGLADLEESIKLWREQGYGDRAGVALLNTASIYGQRGQNEESQRRLAQARQLFVLSQDTSGLMWVNQLEAIQAREAAQNEESAARAGEALSLARQVGNIDHEAMTLRSIGAARLKQNRLDEATTFLNDALKLDERSGSPHSMARTLFWQGEVLTTQNRPDEALIKYKRAIDLIENMRATMKSASAYGENKYIYEVYESVVSLLIKMGRPAEAFDYLGRSKSKKLQDSLRLTNLKTGDATLQAQLDRAAALHLRLTALEGALQTERGLPSEQQSATKIASLQERSAAAKQELDAVAAQIKAARPGLAAATETVAQQGAPSLINVQKQIPANAALVQWAPVGDKLYAFVVTQNAVQVQLLPTSAEAVWNHVREFRGLLSQARRAATSGENIAVTNWLSEDASVKPLRENLLTLRQMLIEPIEAKFANQNTIVFVPNRALYYLPLHALAKREGNGLKFFGQEKQVAYLAAADVLSVLQKAPSRGSGFLALGNPSGADLPAAGEEATVLARLFPASQIYTGAQATKTNVVTPQNENRRIWHLATHGVLNATQPERSYILLAPGAKAGDEELTVGEVYGLNLKDTDLVTLSACQTAIGERDPDGLEITSLATAFARAGADSVVASLWSVADDSTRDFMVEFYKRLAAGEPKSAAMQGAQNKLIADARTNHPFYWAPFVLMGDWR